jgi:four helix bundle protein
MLSKFRSYQLALRLYRGAGQVVVSGEIKDQLQRACLSVVLNLAEGSAKPSLPERKRFYRIALASLREVQALVDAEPGKLGGLYEMADRAGASLYRLATC